MELPSVAGDPASSGDPVITPTTAARATAASPATTTHTPRCLIRSRRGRVVTDQRSEERRVGKECVAGSAPFAMRVNEIREQVRSMRAKETHHQRERQI